MNQHAIRRWVFVSPDSPGFSGKILMNWLRVLHIALTYGSSWRKLIQELASTRVKGCIPGGTVAQ